MGDAVRAEVSQHVATVVFDRPDRGNAFTLEMIDAFRETLARISGDPEIRAVVLTGTGRSFSTGADFTAMPAIAARSGLSGVLGIQRAIESLYDAFLAVDRLQVPTIAAVNGHAVGGGLGIALLCDIRIVAERAKIGANFSRLGIHPGMAISHLLPAAIGFEAAAELLYTGRLVRGAEAVELGLARRALPADQVLPAAVELAAEIAAAAPLAVQAIKRTLRGASRANLSEVLRNEAQSQALLMQSADAQEGIRAMLEKREPTFRGE